MREVSEEIKNVQKMLYLTGVHIIALIYVFHLFVQTWLNMNYRNVTIYETFFDILYSSKSLSFVLFTSGHSSTYPFCGAHEFSQHLALIPSTCGNFRWSLTAYQILRRLQNDRCFLWAWKTSSIGHVQGGTVCYRTPPASY